MPTQKAMSKYATAHASPRGAGDSRPTALQIVNDEAQINELPGKVFVVTGCSAGGLGIETARALHATGADVFVTTRNSAKAQSIVDDIHVHSTGQGRIEHLHLELDSLESVRAAAEEFLRRSKKLDVIVNNAAVMACPEGATKDGFETQFGTNYLGHFLLFELLRPTLLASSTPDFNSRVVSVSSSGHRASTVLFDDLDLKKGGYQPWKAYGQAKTANIWLALEIERRYGSQGLHANALHPGGIWTPLQRHNPGMKEKYGDNEEVQKYMKSTEQGAATSVYAAISRDWEGRGGKYLENCTESQPHDGISSDGYAPHAYDATGAQRLWELSLKLVGLA